MSFKTMFDITEMSAPVIGAGNHVELVGYGWKEIGDNGVEIVQHVSLLVDADHLQLFAMLISDGDVRRSFLGFSVSSTVITSLIDTERVDETRVLSALIRVVKLEDREKYVNMSDEEKIRECVFEIKGVLCKFGADVDESLYEVSPAGHKETVDKIQSGEIDLYSLTKGMFISKEVNV